MSKGISNFLPLVLVVIHAINTGDKMGHENNWPNRITHLIGFFPRLMGLASIKWDEISPEFKDLDAEERKTVLEEVKKEFDIIDDKLEFLVEDAFSMTSKVVNTVVEAIAYVKKTKEYFKAA